MKDSFVSNTTPYSGGGQRLMPTATQARTVFISYAREDEHLILPVAHLLRAAGTIVFLDQEDIPYGDQWESVLLEQLRAAERILVFWSINAAKSEWVRREYLMAIGAGLRVVPIPLDETPLSTELAAFQALASLVPLVYQARRIGAPLRMWGTGWRPWISGGAALMAAFISLLASWSDISPAAAEISESTPLPGVSFWVLGVLIVILLSGLLVLKRAPASAQRGGNGLQAAIYDAIFGETTSREDA